MLLSLFDRQEKDCLQEREKIYIIIGKSCNETWIFRIYG